MEETITFEIDKSAALVLLDFLWRWQTKGLGKTLTIEDDAEWHALAVIQGRLEEKLAEPFSPDYDELVRQAREKLIEQYGRLADDSDIETE